MANNAKISRLFEVNIEVDQTGADESGNRDQRQGCVTQILPSSGASSVPPGSSNNSGNCSSSAPGMLFDINIEVKSDDHDQKKKGKKKSCNGVGDEKKRRSVKKKRGDEEEDQRPVEEIPAKLLQIVEELNGTSPVFLYGKKLEESDVRKNQNRLFVTARKKFMDFWRLEVLERGVLVEGIDANNNTYDLGLTVWGSLKQLVIKKEWHRLVRQHGAEKGDWVQVWGFRVDGIACLAINFIKAQNPDSASASGSGNKNNGEGGFTSSSVITTMVKEHLKINS